MSGVKEYFVLIYSTRISFISLILDVFLQWSSLIFGHDSLNSSSEMHPSSSYKMRAIPNLTYFARSISNAPYFMIQFTIRFSLSWILHHSDFTCTIGHHILLFIHSNSLSTFHFLGTISCHKDTKMNKIGSLASRRLQTSGGDKKFYGKFGNGTTHKIVKEVSRGKLFQYLGPRKVYPRSWCLSQVFKDDCGVGEGEQKYFG